MEQIIDHQPLTVTPDTPLMEAVSLMQNRGNSCSVESSEDMAASNSSCVLIVENNRLLGIFTERDLVKLIAFGNPAGEVGEVAESSQMIATETDLAWMAIEKVMSREVITLTHTGAEDIFAALNLLRSHGIRHLPIVDGDNNLLGLTTIKNLRQKLQPVNMMRWRQVTEIMKTGLIHADPEDSVRHIARLMAEHQVSCVAICQTLPETDLVQPLGIITERDIVQFQNLSLDFAQPVKDVMSTPLFLVSPDDSLWSVHQQMQQHRVRRLLVSGKNGELVGIITQTSLLQVFDPAEMYGVMESLQQQVCQLELSQKQLLENRQLELENELAERTAALRTANQQGKAIAELGQYALMTGELALILQRAVYIVADTLQVKYCKVLKLLPDNKFLLEAGVGWQNDLIGTAVIGIERNSQAGYTLQQSQPVVVEDLRTETRFQGANLLIEHRVISSMSVVIADGGKPYGVLSTHSIKYRVFTPDDLNFLSVIANIIAQANKRLQTEKKLHESQERFDLAVRGSRDGLWDWNILTDEVFYAQRFKAMLGYTDAEMPNIFAAWSSKLHPEDRERVLTAVQNHLEDRVPFDVEYRLQTKQSDYCWFNAKGQAIWDEDGKAIRMAGSITDISDRKQAEIALKASEQKFRAIFDKSFQFIGLLEPNGNIIEANQTALDFIGLTSADIRGKPFWLTPWWSYSSATQELIKQAIVRAEKGEFVRFEVEHPGTGNRVITVDFSLTPIKDDTGRVVMLIPEGRNISDRKQAEAALQESEQRFRNMADNAPMMVWVTDETACCTFVSQSWCDFTGQTKETALGFGWLDAVHPEDLGRARTIFLEANERQKAFQLDYRVRRHDGEYRWAIDAASPWVDNNGQFKGYIGSVIDISDRKQAEAKIKEQAALLDITTDAIMVRALDNRILFWNRGAEVLYGWETAEILNRNCDRFFKRISTSKLNEIQQTVREIGEWQGELKQVTKAGTEIIVESRWTLVKNEAGEPNSYLVVNTDITEQKQLEAQFLRTQRLESLGTLAGGIAHDLNNILAPILGFAKLLPLKLPDVDEQTKGFFKIMETNAQRGTALVKQILTFSRGLEGDQGIVQIRHLINEIEQIITETFPKSIELSIDAPKTLWTVNADINQLHQVLMNLCVNARDAMPDGGKLSIKAENFTVDSEYARLHLDAELGSYVKVTVTDTGVGIPPEIIDRIFEPFFTTKTIGRGTGLGLSTVIGIVKSHGGFIEVISDRRREQETQFQVFLPANDTIDSQTTANEAIPLGNGELILVVDDESSILEVTKATLETYNYRVITVNNGIEAVATYANNKDVSLVIMDIMMPGMDGKTAIRTLKQIDPDATIIAVSGLITSQEIIQELDGDVTAFLSKPYSNEDLLIQIDEIIRAC